MSDTLTIDFKQPLPLFPLPNCVLLPHATIQLHIFEPRYRQMTADVLGDRPLIAMALFEGEDWKQDYQGAPPLRPFVCVGMINHHVKLPDGRYNLQLQGLCRAQLEEEVETDRLYREAILSPTEPTNPMEIDLEQTRARIMKLLKRPQMASLASVSALLNCECAEMPTTALIDLAAMTCSGTLEERYEALREADPLARGRWVERLLGRISHSIALAERFAPAQDDSRCHRN